jgi:hypothetical protein
MTALIQEINVRAAEFLEKQQEQQLQQQQKQAVSAEASP